MNIDHATLIAYARKNGWKAAVNLMDTHNRIADGDDQLIDTVECVYMSERKADACWLAAAQIQEAMQHVTLSSWR